MTKLILLALVVVPLFGCAQARITERDLEKSTVTACGNKYADEDYLRKTAQNKCSGELTTIREFQQANGAVGAPVGRMFIAAPTNDSCIEFRCSDRAPAASK